MNSQSTKYAFCHILVSLLVVLPLAAKAQNATPVNVEFTADAKTYNAGTPILLHYHVTNTSFNRIGVHTGMDASGWYTFTLTDANGQSRSISPVKAQVTGSEVLSAAPDLNINSNDSFSNDLVVPGITASLAPGSYTLAVHINLPYAGLPSDTSYDTDAAPYIAKAGTTYTQDIAIPIVIMPFDDLQLRAAAQNYTQSIMQGHSSASMWVLADALFSMPEAQAADSWETLSEWAATHSFAGRIATDRLGRKSSARAAGILADIAWSKSDDVSREAKADALFTLNQMYGSAKRDVKAHIKTLYVQNKVAPPTVFYHMTNGN